MTLNTARSSNHISSSKTPESQLPVNFALQLAGFELQATFKQVNRMSVSPTIPYSEYRIVGFALSFALSLDVGSWNESKHRHEAVWGRYAIAVYTHTALPCHVPSHEPKPDHCKRAI